MARRQFLAGAAALTLLAGCEQHPGKAAMRLMRGWNERFEEYLFSPSRLAPELPASAQTPEKDFQCFFKSPVMPVASSGWCLKIGGLVRHPTILTLDQIFKMPVTDMRVRHYCINGWTAVASWRGVRVSEIARLAGLDPQAKYVEFRSFDAGYWSSWDLASVMHPQTLLAYGMNGHPLGADHGAPLRLYSAIKLGYKSVKYLTEIIFMANKTGGTCEDAGEDWFAGV